MAVRSPFHRCPAGQTLRFVGVTAYTRPRHTLPWLPLRRDRPHMHPCEVSPLRTIGYGGQGSARAQTGAQPNHPPPPPMAARALPSRCGQALDPARAASERRLRAWRCAGALTFRPTQAQPPGPPGPPIIQQPPMFAQPPGSQPCTSGLTRALDRCNLDESASQQRQPQNAAAAAAAAAAPSASVPQPQHPAPMSQDEPCTQQAGSQQPSQLMRQVLGRGLHIEISQQYSQDLGWVAAHCSCCMHACVSRAACRQASWQPPRPTPTPAVWHGRLLLLPSALDTRVHTRTHTLTLTHTECVHDRHPLSTPCRSARRTPDFATPVEQQFHVDYDISSAGAPAHRTLQCSTHVPRRARSRRALRPA